MNKIRSCIIEFYRLVTVTSIVFVTWKLVCHWRAGLAEKTGRSIDISISSAAEKLEKTAIALEEWADSGLGENLGKGLDEVLMDTKKTLDTATDLVQCALNKAK